MKKSDVIDYFQSDTGKEILEEEVSDYLNSMYENEIELETHIDNAHYESEIDEVLYEGTFEIDDIDVDEDEEDKIKASVIGEINIYYSGTLVDVSEASRDHQHGVKSRSIREYDSVPFSLKIYIDENEAEDKEHIRDTIYDYDIGLNNGEVFRIDAEKITKRD